MKYKNYNDYELIYMIREKDENSYDILFHKYLPIIKRIASDYYKSYSSYGYDLDDFIQEGYVAFQKALKKFDERKETLFYTFVVLCIHRSLISFCHMISCGKHVNSLFTISLDELELSDGIDYGYDYLSSMELYHSIWDIIYCFSFDLICVFELRWNHFQFNEISQLLDIPVRRTQTLYKKSLLSIQRKLEKIL